jgi:hypothetical protein
MKGLMDVWILVALHKKWGTEKQMCICDFVELAKIGLRFVFIFLHVEVHVIYTNLMTWQASFANFPNGCAKLPI